MSLKSVFFLCLFVFLTTSCESPTAFIESHCRRDSIEVPSNEGGRLYFNYCAHLNPKQTTDLLIFMHGAFQSERQLSKQAIGDQAFPHLKKLVEDHFKDRVPHAIAVSFGPVWILAPNRKWYPKSLTPQNFLKIISFIREKHNIQAMRIHLVGMSMGGWNAIQLFLHQPAAFSSATFLDPMIPRCANPVAIENAFSNKCGAEAFIYRTQYNDFAHFAQNDPFKFPLIKALHSRVPLLFSVSLKDTLLDPSRAQKLFADFKIKQMNATLTTNEIFPSGPVVLGGAHGNFDEAEVFKFISSHMVSPSPAPTPPSEKAPEAPPNPPNSPSLEKIPLAPRP